MDDVFILKKPREELTFSDLRHHFGTGRSYIKSGSGVIVFMAIVVVS